MYLSELIADSGARAPSGAGAADIRGLTADSREVRAGWLFAAFPGARQDGRSFIKDAVAAGAAAILAPSGTQAETGGAVLVTAENPRAAFARMAAAFYGAQVPVTVAVTGTNGKSSTVNFCRQMWQAMDHAAASLGTLGIVSSLGVNRPGALTTPDPVTLHAEIAELAAAGVTHLALEASSQGLHQHRLDGLKVTAAGFTNLTRDHLDYHGTMEAYFDCKMRLFGEILAPGGVAVINADAAHASAVRGLCEKRELRVIDYGARARDIRLLERRALSAGQFLSLEIMGERYSLELPLAGDFQAENALCALGLVIAADPGSRALHMQAVHALEGLQPVRGRLEAAGSHPNGAAVFVDYAHTPDGLETMLHALRPHTRGRLHVVFGCGGDRDRGKRPLMGAAAAALADRVIVTDDNPRGEDPAQIRREILAACPGAEEIGDRRAAIRAAVRGLAPGDALVIAGKGHEQGQIVGRDVLPFDDAAVARAAVMEIAK